ncbi:MAG: hypothetical protein Kow0037_12540 [Calditrichia bacterium]
MSNTPKPVLVLGVDDRAALAVIRSLGRRGIPVHQGTDTPSSICRYSKYVEKVISLPSVSTEPEKWVEAVLALLTKKQYSLLIPTADNYLVQVVRHRQKFETLVTCAIPDDHGFEVTYDKNKTLALAAELGVPIPKTEFVESARSGLQICREWGFPVIVKPVSSKVWKNGRRYSLRVESALNEAQLKKIFNRVLPLSPVLIQRFHKGIGVGQEFLCREGEIVAAFQHERVHEPLKGGGSSYRKSVPLDSRLLQHSEALLKAMKWTGVAMVEYKYNPSTREFVLMEINGRFWGSLPLAIASGVDFPYLLYKMLVLGEVTPVREYKTNVYCRNLVRDLEWLKENLRSDRKNPMLMTVPMTKVLGEIRNILTFREHFDVLQWHDPRPGLVAIGRYLVGQFSGMAEKVRRKLWEFNFRFNKVYRKWRYHRLQRRLRGNLPMHFVCKGNICRSPFAEIYLKKKLNNADALVYSSGFITRTGRSSPETAQAVAKKLDVDLSVHRSRHIAEVLKEGQLVFLLDFELYNRFRKEYPEYKNSAFLLTELDPNTKQADIPDPYGREEEYFKIIFSRMAGLLDKIVEARKNN